jgi:hypothetical protein
LQFYLPAQFNESGEQQPPERCFQRIVFTPKGMFGFCYASRVPSISEQDRQRAFSDLADLPIKLD